MQKILCSLALMLAFHGGNAQILNVADINSSVPGSSPFWLTVFDNKLCFMAKSDSNGTELYQCDMADNVSMVANTSPGTYGPIPDVAGSQHEPRMAVLNGKLYFAHTDTTYFDELCIWDGTNPPTVLSKLNPTANSIRPRFWTALGNKVYFIRNWGDYPAFGGGTEVCEYDPATHNINVIQSGERYHYMVCFQGKLYISAFMSTNPHTKLYCYDPSVGMTVVQGSDTAYKEPYCMAVLANKLYFIAADPTTYKENFYVYTGSGSPQKLTNNGTGAAIRVQRAFYNNMGEFNGDVYFIATEDGDPFPKLYRTTTAGNVAVVHSFNVAQVNMGHFANYNNKLYFQGADSTYGAELWQYNGVTPPHPVMDLMPGAWGGAMELTVFNNSLYFAAMDSAHGIELFKLHTWGVVENVKNISNIKAYPNPASAILNIEFTLRQAATASVQLTDMAGKEVYRSGIADHSAGTVTHTITTDELSPGIYFYRILNEQQSVLGTGKFVKE